MAIILDDAQALRPLRTITVPFGATATTATGVLKSKVIRLHTTAAVCIDFGETGTAATTDFPMAAEQTEYIRTATSLLFSVVARDSAATGIIGTLYITEC